MYLEYDAMKEWGYRSRDEWMAVSEEDRAMLIAHVNVSRKIQAWEIYQQEESLKRSNR